MRCTAVYTRARRVRLLTVATLTFEKQNSFALSAALACSFLDSPQYHRRLSRSLVSRPRQHLSFVFQVSSSLSLFFLSLSLALSLFRFTVSGSRLVAVFPSLCPRRRDRSHVLAWIGIEKERFTVWPCSRLRNVSGARSFVTKLATMRLDNARRPRVFVLN